MNKKERKLETMNKKVGLTPILDRAHKLGVSYLSNAIATNGIAKETIKRFLKKKNKRRSAVGFPAGAIVFDFFL